MANIRIVFHINCSAIASKREIICNGDSENNNKCDNASNNSKNKKMMPTIVIMMKMKQKTCTLQLDATITPI